jgi:uncharacterized YigZ family protein
MSELYIPSGAGGSEYVEKRSRFLGHVRLVESEEEARAAIADFKKQYYDARHNCWCYRLPDGTERYSDDGEPQGTAGLPMLEVFRREGLQNVLCVVTRYFGGVLLGTGGLFRAYTRSAKDALDAAGVSVLRRWVELEIPCSYAALERYKQELAAFEGVPGELDYGAAVTVCALIPEERAVAFCARILDISGGAVEPRPSGERLQPVPLP